MKPARSVAAAVGLRDVPRTAWLLAGLAALVRFVWVGVKGVSVSPDGHTYLGWGAQLLAGDMSLDWHVLYLGIVLWAAVLQAAFGPAAPTAWVLLQSAVVALATIPLYLLARDLYGDRVAVLASLVHVFLFESFQWEAYTLSDSLFQAGVIAFAFFAVRSEIQPAPRWRAWRNVVLVALVLLRPVGIVVAGTFFVWKARSVLRTAKGRRAAGVAAGVVALAVMLALPSLAAFADKMGSEYATSNAAGIVYDDDTERVLRFDTRPYEGGLASYVVANPLDFLALCLVRFAAFFTIALSRYSTAHVALNVVTLAPLFGVGLVMVGRTLVRGGPQRLLAGLVVAFAAFHAVTLLDYDLRYRDPVLPLLAVFFAGACVPVLERAWARVSSTRQPRRQEVHHEAGDDADAS